jgi:hypothetical protein
MAKHRSSIWRQMRRDKFLVVLSITICATMAYSIAPVIRSVIN